MWYLKWLYVHDYAYIRDTFIFEIEHGNESKISEIFHLDVQIFLQYNDYSAQVPFNVSSMLETQLAN